MLALPCLTPPSSCLHCCFPQCGKLTSPHMVRRGRTIGAADVCRRHKASVCASAVYTNPENPIPDADTNPTLPCPVYASVSAGLRDLACCAFGRCPQLCRSESSDWEGLLAQGAWQRRRLCSSS